MDSDQPGQLFSEVYFPRREAVQDDPRMRRRIGALFDELRWESTDYAGTITKRLGIGVPSNGYAYRWTAFFTDTPINDLMDVVTIIAHEMRAHQGEALAGKWLSGIQEIFDQQNVSYRVERRGGVRFRVDAAMTALTTSAISSLSQPQFGQVASHLDAAMTHIDRSPADYASAIRGVFSRSRSYSSSSSPQPNGSSPSRSTISSNPRRWR